MPSKCYLSFSPVHPSSLRLAFSSFLFATVYHALNSQNDPPGTPFASGCSLDHKSQMTSHRQVQSPLHLPSKTLSYWLHLLLMLHLLLLRTRTFWLWLPFSLACSSLPCFRCLTLLEGPFWLSIPGHVPHYFVDLSLL